MELNDGTPQGSSCSCSLFAIFVGDLGLWTSASLLLAYANDTCITVVADSIEELQEKLELEGERVLKYFANNKMVANPEKTGLLVLRPTHSKASIDQLTIDLLGSIIYESEDQKLLGVQMQNNLKFTKQIEKVKKELQYALSVMSRLSKTLRKKELKQIAHGIFMSKLSYCLSVYGSSMLRTKESDAQSTLLQSLQVCQNDLLRILTGNKRSDRVRVQDMLTEKKMLSVNQLLGYSMIVETWKARNFNIPVLCSLLGRKRPLDNKTLRSDTFSQVSTSFDEPFAKGTAMLWNMSSDRFKSINLLVVAKSEARKLAELLPL